MRYLLRRLGLLLVTGWAALVLPFGTDAAGRPLAVQLMAPDEAVLLRLGAQLERA